jgi:hypothetical protein
LAQAKLDAHIDRLYGLPLDEFVLQRDALAKQLRADGDRDAASAVKALRKPTAGAWALNQAVRRRREETGALLAAGERLRAAHQALLSGGGRDELREAMGQQRALSNVLADCAEAIASETGKSGPALKERVRSTLHAAALDDDVRSDLAAGRLVREREAVGLGGVFGESDAAAPAASAPPRSGRAERTKLTERTQRAERAERTEAQRAESAEAQRLAAEAQAAVEEAQAAVEDARAAHEDASEHLEAARAAAGEAQVAQREAGKLLRRRERELAKREQELRRLRD